MHKTKQVYRLKYQTQPAVYLEVSTRDELAAALVAAGEAADKGDSMAAMMWGDVGADYHTDRLDLRHEGYRLFTSVRKSKSGKKSNESAVSRSAQPLPDDGEYPLFDSKAGT